MGQASAEQTRTYHPTAISRPIVRFSERILEAATKCSNSATLQTPEDAAAGLPTQIVANTVQQEKWERGLLRVHTNGEQFTAPEAVTPHPDTSCQPIGILPISFKYISGEARIADELRKLHEDSRALLQTPPDLTLIADAKGMMPMARGQTEKPRSLFGSKTWSSVWEQKEE